MPQKLQYLTVNRRIRVPIDEIRLSFVRSGGPGGQNVNKLSTKAQLHWNVLESTAVPAEVKERFCKRFARRINTQGEVVMTSQRYRVQGRNAEDCLEKLREMLAWAATRPTVRRATLPTRASQRRRLEQKRKRSEKKGRRRPPGGES